MMPQGPGDFEDIPDMEDEDDEDIQTEGQLIFYCECLENDQPCANHGACIHFDVAQMQIVICPHFIMEDAECEET